MKIDEACNEFNPGAGAFSCWKMVLRSEIGTRCRTSDSEDKDLGRGKIPKCDDICPFYS